MDKHNVKLKDKATFFCKESVVQWVIFYILTAEDFHKIIPYEENYGVISL